MRWDDVGPLPGSAVAWFLVLLKEIQLASLRKRP
jgi:hypothetical protein